MVKAVIFDMDGVLVDSEYTYFQSKSAILKEAGHEVEESYHYQFMGTTGEYMWRKMKEEFQLPLTPAEYTQMMNQRRTEIITKNGIRSFEGVSSVVQMLHAKGLPLAVASSSSAKEIISNLKELQLFPFFTAFVSSEEVAHSKPAPDVYLEAARRLGVAPEDCLAVEDTKNGSLAAKRAQMTCVAFANPAHPPQDLAHVDGIMTAFEPAVFEQWLKK